MSGNSQRGIGLGFLLTLLAAVGSVENGCSETANGAPSFDAGATRDVASEGAGRDSGGLSCLPRDGAASDPIPIVFQGLNASISDMDASPLPGVPVAVCGKGACTTGTESGSDGSAVLKVTPLSLDRPTARWGDGVFWPLLGVRLTSPSANVTLRTLALTDTRKIVQGSIELKSGVTLEIPSNIEPSFDPFLFDTDAKKTLRYAITASKAEAELLAPGLDFDIIVALGPAPIALCGSGPGASLKIQNNGVFPNGTVLDFYQFEFDALERVGTFGEWRRVSGGAASEVIATTPSEGLRVITTVGITRRKTQ